MGFTKHTDTVIAGMRESYVGRRVRLDFTSDEFTTLRAGDEGVISSVDDMGTVHVNWDNGSSLGMVRDAGDRFTFLD